MDQPDYIDTGIGTPDRLQRLWAPYRMNYIAKGAQTEKGPGDPFLRVPTMSDREGLIVVRAEHSYVVLNLYPYNPGHLLVVPFRKVANLEDLSFEESTEIMKLAQESIRVIKHVSQPHAFNVGFNLGKPSGGSVGDHLHMHIVPRWSGDANFMTVIDGVKVLPQKLQDTRELLAQGWIDLGVEIGTVRIGAAADELPENQGENFNAQH
ncbi:MAG: HIT domain-containing protein [Corynebacterium sp.]|nr:HIT domain-containing protein [Corynebacterium sp.]